MDLSPFVESIRSDLLRAADLGDAGTRAAAERLTVALEPALRLGLMSALSEAAAEITAALEEPAVEVRLQGGEPAFVVTQPAPALHPGEGGPPADADEDDSVSRITLRIPEALKVRAEALAASRGQSLNTWLVNAARAALAGSEAHDGPGRHGRKFQHRNRVRGWAQ